MKILVSACLLGENCKYNGGNNYSPKVAAFLEGHQVIPVCPEQLGGLATPRSPAERQGERIIAKTGVDVTDQYHRGAEEALKIYRLLGCEAAVLKERSPSCGSGEIYDGTFTGTLLSGNGVTAELFLKHGIPVYGESRLSELLK